MLKTILRWLMAAFYVGGGVNHFVNPDFYMRIMPPYLPWHLDLVYVSGVFEILGGVGVLIPRLRRAAAWGLIALLVAVFPANVYLATHPELMPNIPPLMHWGRLPLQPVLIAWAWWYAKR